MNHLKNRARAEILELLGIVSYLWVMFGVFALHEAVLSAKAHTSFRFYGFAVFNSIIFGKVMLIAEKTHFGEWFKNKPLAYSIVCKAVLFAILFICVDVIEETVVGISKGKTIAQSLPSIGGGTPSGVFFVGVILAIALIPFFAYRELGRVIGVNEFRALLFTRRS